MVYRVLMGQTVVMLLLAGFGAAKLSPGTLAPALRESVMNENAHQYAIMRWLDRTLPEDAIVLSTLRSHAVMPRAFAAEDIVTWTDWASQQERQRALSVLKAHKPDTLVSEPATALELADKIGVRCGEAPVTSESLLIGTRNPWNGRESTKLAVYGTCFATGSPGCTDYFVTR